MVFDFWGKPHEEKKTEAHKDDQWNERLNCLQREGQDCFLMTSGYEAMIGQLIPLNGTLGFRGFCLVSVISLVTQDMPLHE